MPEEYSEISACEGYRDCQERLTQRQGLGMGRHESIGVGKETCQNRGTQPKGAAFQVLSSANRTRTSIRRLTPVIPKISDYYPSSRAFSQCVLCGYYVYPHTGLTELKLKAFKE